MPFTLYVAVVSTAFDSQADIVYCHIFQNEEDVVKNVINKVFEEDLISRERFLEITEDEYIDEYHEKIQEMSDEEFKEMVVGEVEANPTIGYLKDICENYSRDFSAKWEIVIKCYDGEYVAL